MSDQLTPHDLIRQAVLTSHSYLSSAIRIIDEEFGDGYAKEHPELIAGFMNTAARDFDTSITHQGFCCLSDDLCRLIDAVETQAECQSSIDSSDINNLINQLGESGRGIAGSMDSIATSLDNLSSTIDRFLPPVEEFISFMPRGKK